jgi:DNA-binding protein HU-beta
MRIDKQRHVAKAASATEIRRSVGVTPQEDERVRRILADLGYLKPGMRAGSKADLINRVVESVEGMTRQKAAQAIEAIFALITDTVKSGESANLPGFGSFRLAERAARQGRNPATGRALTIRSRKVVRFIPSKQLKESVNTAHRGR